MRTAVALFAFAPSTIIAEAEPVGAVIDRRWDLVAAAVFGLAVSVVGLRRWGHAPSGSGVRGITGPGDSVTVAVGGGANEPSMKERRATRRSLRPSTGSAVLKLDAGQIDALTRRYGADGAATVLRSIERRAKSHLRGEHDRLVTLNRGEMVIMLEGLSDPLGDAERIAKRLSADALRPVDHKGALLFPSLNIGIAHSKVPGDLERLLAEADRALQETSGKDRIALNNSTGSITKP